MTTAENRPDTGAAPEVERWLVDGNNVMGSRPDGWWRDRPAAKARLAAEIRDWAAVSGRPVVLFFDGRTDRNVRAAAEPVEVRFADAAGPDAADHAIVAEAEPGDTVVTADRGLVDRLPPGVAIVGPTVVLAELGTGPRSGSRRARR